MTPDPHRRATLTQETLVSICIPTFNNGPMLDDAIASALNQTYRNIEVVVLDNHSTDATQAVTQAWAGKDSRLRAIRHEQNIGMTGNFNRAIDAARGNYVLILCADDLLDRRCIEVLASELDREPGCTMAACARQIVDEALGPVGVRRFRATRTRVSGQHLTLECFANGNVVGEPSAVLFRRTAAGQGFNESYCQLLDLDMWLGILQHGDAVLLPEAHCRIRRHAAQWSETNMKSGRLLRDKKLFFREHAAQLGPALSVARKLHWDLRMASSVLRSQAHVCNGSVENPAEVFFPYLFPQVRWCVALAYTGRSVLRRAYLAGRSV